jgi:FKBP-type peptidyl-prolyl cis-trans isomerase FklB
MKVKILSGIIAAGIVLASCSGSKSKSNAKLETKLDSVSYAMGLFYGRQLKNMHFKDVNHDLVKTGMKEALAGDSSLFDVAGTYKILTAYTEYLSKEISKKNEAEGKEFLAKNKTKTGVVALPSGVQYEVVKQGNGPVPKATDIVKVNYLGTFLNGEEFDNSFKRNSPATFRADQVIKGWTQLLQIMPVGSKYKAWIPAEFAYGDRGSNKVEPGQLLVFEIDLLSIEPPKENPAAMPMPNLKKKPGKK